MIKKKDSYPAVTWDNDTMPTMKGAVAEELEEQMFYPQMGAKHGILEVLENERAVEDEEVVDVTEARKHGCFSDAVGMAQIQNVLNNRLYASITADKSGNRVINFCERYPNGEFSPKMSILQGDLLMLHHYEYNPDITSVKGDKQMKSQAVKVFNKLRMDYLNKFNGEEPTPMEYILEVLHMVRLELPVYKDKVNGYTPTAEDFYCEVARTIETHPDLKNWPTIHEHRSYYALNDEAVEIVAHEMAMKPQKLLQQLYSYGFLYLTKSSTKGFKTKVRYRPMERDGSKVTDALIDDFQLDKPTVDRAYCIYKYENFGKLVK